MSTDSGGTGQTPRGPSGLDRGGERPVYAAGWKVDSDNIAAWSACAPLAFSRKPRRLPFRPHGHPGRKDTAIPMRQNSMDYRRRGCYAMALMHRRRDGLLRIRQSQNPEFSGDPWTTATASRGGPSAGRGQSTGPGPPQRQPLGTSPRDRQLLSSPSEDSRSLRVCLVEKQVNTPMGTGGCFVLRREAL